MTPTSFLAALRPTFDLDFFVTRNLGVLLLLVINGGSMDFGHAKREMRVPGPTMSRLVDKLAQHKFTSTKRHPVDRRRVTVCITDKGRDFVASVLEAS